MDLQGDRLIVKRCYKCGIEKDASDYCKDSSNKDGLFSWCKECAAKHHRNWYSVDVELRRDVRRDYVNNHKSEISEYDYEYRTTNRNKKNAQLAVKNALCRGDIDKQPCFICGDNAHAHHPDYDRPLDVVWLCPMHHMQTHAIVKGKL